MPWWWPQTTYSPGGSEVSFPVTRLTAPRRVGPGVYERSIQVDGRDRYYLFNVPPNYRDAYTDAVLYSHGGGGNASLGEHGIDGRRVSNRDGYIGVFLAGSNPWDEQTNLYWNTGRPMRPYFQRYAADDVKYVLSVVQDLKQFVGIHSVFAAGISNGAQFCFRMAAEIQFIKAIATFGGRMTVQEVEAFTGKTPRKFPILMMDGELDTFAPIDGGGSVGPGSPFVDYQLASLDATLDSWSKYNGTYIPVKSIVVPKNGHCWPGGQVTKTEIDLGCGRPSMAVDASVELWSFFKGTR